MTAALALLALLAQPAAAAPEGGVPYARLRDAQATPHDWLTYSGSYRGDRHSPLAQIDSGNVARVQPLWVYQSREAGKLETSPLVIDGVLYITEKPHIVTALDGRTGRPLWSYRRPPAVDVPTCCGPVNRGLAVLGDALFLGTLDAHLVSLDLRTGKLRWDVTVADARAGHSITVAPLAVKDKIVVGIAGGEFGIRGFLDAYRADSGERAWRFWTVPAPGQPGHDTWKGEAWKTGGGPTWVTGSYDPALDLIYWGTGNPSPDYNGDGREGDNLYTDCLLALEPDTGKLRWHFQFTPHDLHDWDANQVPILFDATVAGRPRKLVAQANRNAFYYVLDRETGELVAGAPFAKQTWASGLDARGRPVLLPNTAPSAEGALVYPGLGGATNWFSPARSPTTGLFYVQAHEDYAQVFFKLDPEYRAGAHFEGGAARDVEGSEHYGVVKALESTTGKVRWEFKLHAPPSGGVLSTGGGLVWSGNREGAFFALDARSGRPLWHFQTGGLIWANPISFAVDGQQRVAIAAGQSIFVFGLPPKARRSARPAR
jgi:alcohol dehydrogenase (cytochrome c)